MKKIFSILFLASVMLFATSSYAQNNNTAKLNTPNTALKKVYDPSRDAMKDIYQAIDEAKSTGRNVLCQVGGNWCPWCLKFADYAQRDTAIRNYIAEHYVYIHVNYSRENRNLEVMKYLGNPGRFGYPVFVIINDKGEPIHIQNSSYLEENKGYNQKKVLDFLANWTPEAIRTIK